MWEETERSPALAAPGSNNFVDLIASSTTSTSGREAGKVQVLSNEEANELCEKYLPLAYRTAGLYMGRGKSPDEVRSASVAGLFEASRRYDPQRGPFGPYARHWCKGEIRALFKPGKDALGRSSSLNIPAFKEDDEGETFLDRCVTDESAPGLNPDVSDLTERERRVILGRVGGETLGETGKALNLSAERVRQIEVCASDKLRKSKGNVARGAIIDLVKRRGYRKPYFTSRSQQEKRLKKIKYPGRHCRKAEIEAYKPQECIPPPNTLPPLWASTPSAAPRPNHPKVKINRDGRWRSLERPGEISMTESEPQALVKAIRLNKDPRTPMPPEQKPALELERYRHEGLRKLNCVPDSYEPEPSKQLERHRERAAALNGNKPLSRGNGPVIHDWRRQ
jgi:RNA polymerase sigma factor (sigma-70 family)